jgi:Lrp/AsnC family leucine-responsive transcriptional regulator
MATNARRNGPNADEASLDDTNRRLLDELQDDARLTLAELGRRVGLSSPAVAERLQRLEQSGVITGYRATVDPRALGYALSVVIRIRPSPGQLQNVAELARRTSEVVECQRITGDDCYLMKAHVRDGRRPRRSSNPRPCRHGALLSTAADRRAVGGSGYAAGAKGWAWCRGRGKRSTTYLSPWSSERCARAGRGRRSPMRSG